MAELTRIKLFVVEQLTDKGWEPAYLQSGIFRDIHGNAPLLGPCTRVRQVKTPAEAERYSYINIDILSELNPDTLVVDFGHNSLEGVEWLN